MLTQAYFWNFNSSQAFSFESAEQPNSSLKKETLKEFQSEKTDHTALIRLLVQHNKWRKEGRKEPEDWKKTLGSEKCGAGGIRTRVQTSVEKAFYMLIPLLIVGGSKETDKPKIHLAASSFATGTAYCNGIPYFILSRRRSWVTGRPAQRGPNDYANTWLGSHGILSIASWILSIHIIALITQRAACLHSSRLDAVKTGRPHVFFQRSGCKNTHFLGQIKIFAHAAKQKKNRKAPKRLLLLYESTSYAWI